MKIIDGYIGLPSHHKGATVALGNFDGVHKGHGAVIAAAQTLVPDAPLGVITFDPHPRQFFQPKAEPFILTPIAQKTEKIARLGVERLHILRFNTAIASMSPETFARDILADGLGIKGVVVGSDFRFGAGRIGDAHLLATLGRELGFKTYALEEVADESGALLSSSTARTALREGRPGDAGDILGAPHTISGIVLKGDPARTHHRLPYCKPFPQRSACTRLWRLCDQSALA